MAQIETKEIVNTTGFFEKTVIKQWHKSNRFTFLFFSDWHKSKRKIWHCLTENGGTNQSEISIKYEDYMNEIYSILKNKEMHYENDYSNFKDSLISNGLHFYCHDISSFLFSILYLVPDDTIIEYDLSDIVSGGWIKDDLDGDLDIYKSTEKIIVLTEGKTDSEFISKSIEIFYPYLHHKYHFLDFEEYKVESSASALAKLIKTFIAVGIKHHIIAIFDNDTTGIKELGSLEKYKIPDHIKILKYPNIYLAKSYPTIGPSGKKKMNVNSLACSIEMYLGEEVLKKDGEFIPVYWKSYDEKTKKYQGEITEKKYVQDTFRKKLKENNIVQFSDMDSILKMIFKAFQS